MEGLRGTSASPPPLHLQNRNDGDDDDDGARWPGAAFFNVHFWTPFWITLGTNFETLLRCKRRLGRARLAPRRPKQGHHAATTEQTGDVPKPSHTAAKTPLSEASVPRLGSVWPRTGSKKTPKKLFKNEILNGSSRWDQN